ncbi:MAG: cysteine--tRNA ligase, partial [Actinomycetia bacterium]|nr:cysteine--tRNA ligase [Actinomycetes bacterium]
MSLRFYNTMGHKYEEFKREKGGSVSIYSCGPTVYDYAHIGNFRSYIFSDILNRYLTYKGYKVEHVMNITDVDDKTIKRSINEKIPLSSLTEKYTAAFFDDL